MFISSPHRATAHRLLCRLIWSPDWGPATTTLTLFSVDQPSRCKNRRMALATTPRESFAEVLRSYARWDAIASIARGPLEHSCVCRLFLLGLREHRAFFLRFEYSGSLSLERGAPSGAGTACRLSFAVGRWSGRMS